MLVSAAVVLAFESRNSDPSTMLLFVLLGLPIIVALAILAVRRTFRAKEREDVSTLSLRLSLLALIAIPLIAYSVAHRMLIPSTIRWDFSYPGQTGTYQKIDFRFLADGKWRKGPSVEGWPLTCRFPGLNADGYPDIQVFESHGHSKAPVEFVYLPENDGIIFWEAVRNDSRLSAAYRPARYFSNSGQKRIDDIEKRKLSEIGVC